MKHMARSRGGKKNAALHKNCKRCKTPILHISSPRYNFLCFFHDRPASSCIHIASRIHNPLLLSLEHGAYTRTGFGCPAAFHPPSQLYQCIITPFCRQPHHKCHLKLPYIRLCRASRASLCPGAPVERDPRRIPTVPDTVGALCTGYMARISR